MQAPSAWQIRIDYRACKLGPDGSSDVYVFNSHINRYRTTVVGVAQLVEPRIVIPVVVGSSPIVHPTFSRKWWNW